MRPATTIMALVLMLGSAGCRKQSAGSTPAAQEDPIEVTTVDVHEAVMPVTLTLTGTLRGIDEADLASPTSGLATAVRFDRNTEVKSGDVLVQLDMAAASLTAAEAAALAKNAGVQADSAEREAKRAQKLKDGGAISQAEYDRMTSQLEVARLSVRAAKARAALGQKSVSDGTVRAPFAGIISERFVDPGEFLMPGARVATLIAVDKLKLEVMVPEAHIGALAPGAEVTFSVAAFPERTFSGKVRLLGAVVRAATRDIVVEALVDNHERTLRPGMFADVRIGIGEAKFPVVPKSALVAHGERRHLFLVKDGQLQEKVVSIGAERGDEVAVIRGLEPGDKVVRAPDASLRNGQPVR